MEVILPPELELLEQQDDIYQGKLGELQQAVQIGWEASQRGDAVDGIIAIEQIRANLKSRYPQRMFEKSNCSVHGG